MALVANLIRTAVTVDGSQSTWTDSTVYGTSNPNRNEVAVYLTAQKVNETLVESALTVTTFDPEVVTVFTTTNDIDGHHRYKFVIIPNWLVGTTYNQFDLVWDPTLNAFYEFINSTPTAGIVVADVNYWVIVADPTTKIANVGTISESGNLIYQIVDKIVDYATATCFVKLGIKNAKENCGGDCSCDNKTYRTFTRIRNLLTSMRLDEAQGLWIAGERAARLAEKYCDECGCLTR